MQFFIKCQTCSDPLFIKNSTLFFSGKIRPFFPVKKEATLIFYTCRNALLLISFSALVVTFFPPNLSRVVYLTFTWAFFGMLRQLLAGASGGPLDVKSGVTDDTTFDFCGFFGP